MAILFRPPSKIAKQPEFILHQKIEKGFSDSYKILVGGLRMVVWKHAYVFWAGSFICGAAG